MNGRSMELYSVFYDKGKESDIYIYISDSLYTHMTESLCCHFNVMLYIKSNTTL